MCFFEVDHVFSRVIKTIRDKKLCVCVLMETLCTTSYMFRENVEMDDLHPSTHTSTVTRSCGFKDYYQKIIYETSDTLTWRGLKEYLARYCVLLKTRPNYQKCLTIILLRTRSYSCYLMGSNFAYMTRTHSVFHVKAFHHAIRIVNTVIP